MQDTNHPASSTPGYFSAIVLFSLDKNTDLSTFATNQSHETQRAGNKTATKDGGKLFSTANKYGLSKTPYPSVVQTMLVHDMFTLTGESQLYYYADMHIHIQSSPTANHITSNLA